MYAALISCSLNGMDDTPMLPIETIFTTWVLDLWRVKPFNLSMQSSGSPTNYALIDRTPACRTWYLRKMCSCFGLYHHLLAVLSSSLLFRTTGYSTVATFECSLVRYTFKNNNKKARFLSETMCSSSHYSNKHYVILGVCISSVTMVCFLCCHLSFQKSPLFLRGNIRRDIPFKL